MDRAINGWDYAQGRKPPPRQEQSDGSHLTGTFGVFYPGTAELSCKGGGGEELKALPLGRVSPGEILRLDQKVEVPKGTRRISITVRDMGGMDRGELGNLILDRD